MTFKEYSQLTIRTLPNLDITYNTPNTDLPHHLLDTIHMRLGMMSEIEELMTAIHTGDKVNIGEELGDLMWYISNDLYLKKVRGHISEEQYNHFVNYKFNQSLDATHGGFLTLSEGVHHSLWAIVFNVSQLADINKRDLAYGESEISEGKRNHKAKYLRVMTYLIAAVNNVAYQAKINMEEYLEKNINKLIQRYPEKFDQDLALNRDLAKERQVLEATDSQENGQPTEQPLA